MSFMATDVDRLQRKLRRAAQRLERVREERDDLVAEATELGLSRREVGRALGMTGAGVQHILKVRRQRRSGDENGDGPSARGENGSNGGADGAS